ncbi:MAG: septation protein A [Betaproteobacteria bacterium HGW-Betaproteobacteria-8]|nr:MAG: septation protein A [Betaproteobacteria bacterium HGW-Betaproteobacteria-8]
MKFLFDLFPVILFFASFKLAQIYPQSAEMLMHLMDYQAEPQQLPILLATAVAIVATLAQILWVKLRHGKVDRMLIISGCIIVFFGGATLLLHDETFIKWKPTVLYWLFGLTLIVANLFFKKNLIRSMMEQQISMPDTVWNKLNSAWAVFFIFLGCLNLFVAYNFTTEAWVNFKLFGTMILMFAFVVGQSLMISKYIAAKDPE